MTKYEEWEKMIEKVESHRVSKEEIVRFLKNNQPKRKESLKRLPCICGCKHNSFRWHMKDNVWFIRCDKCDKLADGSKLKIQAIRNWNEMIKKEKESETSI